MSWLVFHDRSFGRPHRLFVLTIGKPEFLKVVMGGKAVEEKRPAPTGRAGNLLVISCVANHQHDGCEDDGHGALAFCFAPRCSVAGVFCAHLGGTTGSAACCAEWLRLSEPIAPTLVFDHEAPPPPAILAPQWRRSLSKREDALGLRPERRRSCEIIEFHTFRLRVFSYLQARKSDFSNNFTASEPFRTAGG
jgi:hypothetical protein